MATAGEWGTIGLLLLLVGSGVLAGAVIDELFIEPQRRAARANCPDGFQRDGGLCVRTTSLGCSLLYKGGPFTDIRTCATNVKSGNGTVEWNFGGTGLVRLQVVDSEGTVLKDERIQLPDEGSERIDGMTGRWGLRIDLEGASGEGEATLRALRAS